MLIIQHIENNFNRQKIIANGRAKEHSGCNTLFGHIPMGAGGTEMDVKMQTELIARAREARENAYAPYSGFKVGAALLAASGRIYSGCNVENVSYGATLCAERAAVCAAITAGERKLEAIAVTAGGVPVSPCGICRQILSEFSQDGTLEVCCDGGENIKVYSLRELLPEAFTEFEPEAGKVEMERQGKENV